MLIDPAEHIGRDPQMARLPHPYRLHAGAELIAKLTGEPPHGEADSHERALGPAVYRTLLKVLEEEPLNNRVISGMARTIPSFARWAEEVSGGHGSSYMGNLYWALDYIRWRHSGRHFLQTTDVLDAALVGTDVGQDIPANYLRAPYATQYIQFGETLSSPLKIRNEVSGWHILEGCYVREGIIPFDDPPDPAGEGGQRLLEFVFTGSSVDKAHALDDATATIVFAVADEDMTVADLLAYANEADRKAGRPLRGQEDGVEQAVEHVAKVLLYLNSDKVERTTSNERSDMAERVARAGPGKRGKLERQMQRLYDRIVIGPRIAAPQPMADAGPSGRAMPTHWRRGHFRNQSFGEGRAQHRLTWIAPILVNPDRAFTPQGKPYVIRT